MAGWVKLDEAFFLHPKALAAGRDGRDLYLSALCWSNQQRTDGVIPAHALPMIAALAGIPDPELAASRLVEVGLWDNHVEGWAVHDFLSYQQSKDERNAWLQRERERKQRARKIRTDNEMANSVRAESATVPQDVRSIDVDVDVDVDVKTSLSSTDLLTESYPQPVDDDDKIEAALQHWADLKATNAHTNRPGYKARLLTNATPDGHRTAITALATAHPDKPPDWLARQHLGQPHPPDQCTNCKALHHTAATCPLGEP